MRIQCLKLETSSYHISSINGGELFERVVADDFNLTERDCVLFMRQICEGVDYLHSKSIVHLDLKVKFYLQFSKSNSPINLGNLFFLSISAREYFMLR